MVLEHLKATVCTATEKATHTHIHKTCEGLSYESNDLKTKWHHAPSIKTVSLVLLQAGNPPITCPRLSEVWLSQSEAFLAVLQICISKIQTQNQL